MKDLILYSIPVFFLLIGVELIISRMRGLTYYRFNDSITNLSCGIGSTVSGIFLKTLTVVAYVKLYQISPLKGVVPNTWWVWILVFMGADFCYYWFHRLAHEISFMWGSHVVHHQSEEYNLSVALRQAWYQGAFSFVFNLPLALIGIQPAVFFVVSQVITLYQFWIHTKLINKLPAPFEFIFNTPSHHRVHHGVNPQYIDKNHAGSLIIWDRMFGTFEPEEEEVVYGITKPAQSWNPVWLNFEYWIELFMDVFKVRQIRNAILMLVKMPGWKPEELGGPPVLKPVKPETFHKYNTEIPAGLNHYVLFQFIIVLIGSTTFLFVQKQALLVQNFWLNAGLASLIIFSLLNLGGIFEKKWWTPILEYIRIILMSVTLMVLLKDSPQILIVGAVTAVIAIVSFVWFSRYSKEFTHQTNSYVQADAA